jgi:hypothetical protein
VGDHFVLTAYNIGKAFEVVVPGGTVVGELTGFNSPLDAATSGDSLAFVLDTGNKRIAKYRWTGSPPPEAAVVSPNGGEVFQVGDEVTLAWSASDDDAVTRVDVLLSRDGGESYQPIAIDVANTGSAEWTVTEPGSDECRLRVIAHDEGDRFGIDRSDATFRIAEGTVSTPDTRFELSFGLGPVPVRDVCRVDFAIPRVAHVRLRIHDVQGREVARIADGAFEAGRHGLSWSAVSGRRPVAAGVYFATLEVAGERTLRRRLVVAP